LLDRLPGDGCNTALQRAVGIGRSRFDLRRRRDFLAMDEIGDEEVFEAIARTRQQRNAEALVMAIGEILHAGLEVLEEAVLAFDLADRAQRDLVAERHVDHRIDLLAVIVADFESDRGLGLEDGLLGGEHHRAAHRVLAEQGALRTLERLDAVEIVEGQAAGSLRDAVDVGDDVLVGVEHLALAADDEFRTRRLEVAWLDLEVRHRELDVADGGHLAGFKLLGADRGDGDGNLLEVFLDAASGDDDVLEAALIVVLRHGGGSAEAAQRHRGATKQYDRISHDYPPPWLFQCTRTKALNPNIIFKYMVRKLSVSAGFDPPGQHPNGLFLPSSIRAPNGLGRP